MFYLPPDFFPSTEEDPAIYPDNVQDGLEVAVNLQLKQNKEI